MTNIRTSTVAESRLVMEESSKGNRVMTYYGPEPPNGWATGTRVIANFLPLDLLERALDLIRTEYPEAYQAKAIEDFYPRFRAIVSRLCKGDRRLFSWLKDKDNVTLVIKNADLIRRAVVDLKAKGKEIFPEFLNNEDAEEIATILRSEE